MLLAVFAIAVLCSALFAWVALWRFPEFRSREAKVGEYRRDVVTAARAASSRLPSILGPSVLLATTVALTFGLRDSRVHEEVVILTLVLVWAETGVGWADDWQKSRGAGLSERVRLLAHCAVTVVAVVGAWQIGPYAASSFIEHALTSLAAGALFLFLVLSTGFTDGVDGLTNTLAVLGAAALIVWSLIHGNATTLMIAVALGGGAVVATVFNAPSNWTRNGSVPRRARAYLGDSGALLYGSFFAAIAIMQPSFELAPLLVAAVTLDGLSVFIQTGLLTPLFRRRLVFERFRRLPTFVPHTEFPVPFLSTPMHQHLNLTGMRPVQVVGSLAIFQVVTAALALAGLAIPIVTIRVLLWLGSVAVLVLPFIVLPSTRGLHIGVVDAPGETAVTIRRGLPFRLRSQPLWRTVEAIPLLREHDIPPGVLGRALHRYDVFAACAVGLHAIGADAESAVFLRRIPPLNLLLRPEAALLSVHLLPRDSDHITATVLAWRQAARAVFQEGRIDLSLKQLSCDAAKSGDHILAAALLRQVRAGDHDCPEASS